MERPPCARCQSCGLYSHVLDDHQCAALTEFEPSVANCPFYKTPEQLYESRKKAYDRLQENGMFNLINYYNLRPPVKYADLVLPDRMEV